MKKPPGIPGGQVKEKLHCWSFSLYRSSQTMQSEEESVLAAAVLEQELVQSSLPL
jgi:hypothetical protein